MKLGKYTGGFPIAGDPSYEGDTSYSIRSQTITLYDTSGILLAGAGSAGSQYSAQQAAKQRAIEGGAKAGDTYQYQYQVYAPVPGKLTTFRYTWGHDVGATNTMADASMAKTSYSELDLTAGLKTWTFDDAFHSDLSLSLGANWQTWTVSGIPGALFDLNQNRIGMPIGLSYGQFVIPRVHGSVRVMWDPLSLFSYTDHDVQNHLDFTVGLHGSAVLLSWLRVEGDASYAKYPVEFGKRDGSQFQVNLNLVLWWEPDFWKLMHPQQ